MEGGQDVNQTGPRGPSRSVTESGPQKHVSQWNAANAERTELECDMNNSSGRFI